MIDCLTQLCGGVANNTAIPRVYDLVRMLVSFPDLPPPFLIR